MVHKLKKYLTRSVPLLCAACLFVVSFSPSASAAELPDLKWTDFPFTSTTVGSAVNYTIDFTSGGDYFIVCRDPYQEYSLGTDPYFVIEESGSYSLDYNTPIFEYDPLFFLGANSAYAFTFEFWGGYYSLDFTQSYFYVRYFDSSGKYIGVELIEAPLDSDTDLYTAYFIPNVMSGTAYIQFSCTLYFDIQLIEELNEATPVLFPVSTFDYHFSVPVDSAINQQIRDKLDQLGDQQNQTNEKLDDAFYGDHGFDSSNSDFSGIGSDLSNSAGQAQDAMNAGMDSLGSMMDSDAFQGTLTVLAAGIDAVFTGHEVTICGVTGNPFTLLTGVAAIAIILMLAMKFIFRKWGSGGSDSSGGGSSDA